MTSAARDIAQRTKSEVSKDFSFSSSPTTTLQSPSSSHGFPSLVKTQSHQAMINKKLKPFATEDVKILLLENVNKTGREALEKQGYQVDFYKSSLPEAELISKIR